MYGRVVKDKTFNMDDRLTCDEHLTCDDSLTCDDRLSCDELLSRDEHLTRDDGCFWPSAPEGSFFNLHRCEFAPTWHSGAN
jgi:hypothetical protein